tara:strand:- start:1539 stop:2819 length:1281 start_codon:yes stop_codon:yes gene_type:complete
VLLKRWSWAVVLVLGSMLVAGCVTPEFSEPIRGNVAAGVTPIVIPSSASGGTFVGESKHEYAIAYHPYPHLLYTDGWYALYFDGDNAIVAYSPDGKTFGNHIMVNHSRVPLGGAALYMHGESVFVIYPDTNNMKLYLRKGIASGGSLQLDDPVEVLDMGQPFTVKIPSLLFDENGLPAIVFSGLEGWGDGGGSRWRARIVKATSSDLSQWSESQTFADAISPNQEAAASASGVFLGGDLALVYEVRDHLMVTTGTYTEGLALTDVFTGTHDYVLASDGEQLHLIYHTAASDPNNPSRMVYRGWTRQAGWSDRVVLGATTPHHTALAIDHSGNVWVFYGMSRSVRVRILQPGLAAFEAERCIISISDDDRAGHAWLSAAPGGDDAGVGLLWMEQHVGAPENPIDGRWNVRFRAFTLTEILALPTCAT